MKRGLGRGEHGLTLVEIIVVLIILAILMSFLGSRILGAGDRAKAELNKTKMQQLKLYIEQFRLRYNKLPSSLNSLVSCTQETGQGCVPLTGEDALKDAWGNPYIYRLQGNGRTYTLKTLGADGQEGGSGVDYDVTITGP